jgi:hypothetical protein
MTEAHIEATTTASMRWPGSAATSASPQRLRSRKSRAFVRMLFDGGVQVVAVDAAGEVVGCCDDDVTMALLIEAPARDREDAWSISVPVVRRLIGSSSQ